MGFTGHGLHRRDTPVTVKGTLFAGGPSRSGSARSDNGLQRRGGTDGRSDQVAGNIGGMTLPQVSKARNLRPRWRSLQGI